MVVVMVIGVISLRYGNDIHKGLFRIEILDLVKSIRKILYILLHSLTYFFSLILLYADAGLLDVRLTCCSVSCFDMTLQFWDKYSAPDRKIPSFEWFRR